MFDLTGRQALVTGASGGLGAAIARALHAAGAGVGLSGTRVEPLEALAAELGHRAHVLPCDLSDAEALAALPRQAQAAMGSVEVIPLAPRAGAAPPSMLLRARRGGRAPFRLHAPLPLHMADSPRYAPAVEAVLRGAAPLGWPPAR